MKTASLHACLFCTLSLSLLALPLRGQDAPPSALPESVAAKLAAADSLPALLKVIDESLEASPGIAPQLASHAVSLRQDEPGAIRAILHQILVINEGRQTRDIAVAAVGALTGSGEGTEESVAEAVSAVVEARPDQSDDVLLALAEAVPDSLKPVVLAAVKQGLRRARIARLAVPGSALRGTANPSNITGGEVSRSIP